MQQMADALRRLKYEVVPEAKFLQWKRTIDVAGVPQEVKVDFLIGPFRAAVLLYTNVHSWHENCTSLRRSGNPPIRQSAAARGRAGLIIDKLSRLATACGGGAHQACIAHLAISSQRASTLRRASRINHTPGKRSYQLLSRGGPIRGQRYI
jgi:hypothetical protein